MIIDTFGGPGGWECAARDLGMERVAGIEWDAAACLTRAAAGHHTIRADVSTFPVETLAGKVTGFISSPECTMFSDAGTRAGAAVLDVLEDAICDAFAGYKTRAAHRRDMARVLRNAGWPALKFRKSKYSRDYKAPVRLTRTQRSLAIRKAVVSASLVIEPARFITAAMPEWIAMEQVTAVLPLWECYARELRRLGYHAWCGKMNAADYGVPQTRVRAVLIASRTRRVARPLPTHSDPRKGAQLFTEPWVSMASALGWGASERPVPTVTAGGVSQGGYEPFPSRARQILSDEQAAGRWVLHTNRGQEPDGSRQTADPRSAPAPALTAKSGGQWVLRTSFGEPSATSGTHEMDPGERPSHAVTTKARSWSLRMDTQSKATLPRPANEPAPTIQFAHRSNLAAWVAERPATTVQGDPRVGRPGHKDRDQGESQFETDSVRITVQEAALLQSFPADYPWQGTKTKQFEQVGNAVPPVLAMHILAEATGLPADDERGAA